MMNHELLNMKKEEVTQRFGWIYDYYVPSDASDAQKRGGA